MDFTQMCVMIAHLHSQLVCTLIVRQYYVIYMDACVCVWKMGVREHKQI